MYAQNINTETIIRLGNEQDLSRVLELIREFAEFQKTPEKVIVTLEQMKREKELFKYFVAEDKQGHIVGFTSFFFCYYSWSGKAIYMDDLYVQPQSRGKGIGKRLLLAVHEHGKAQNCYTHRWQVSNWNSNAIDFYKSHGAVINEIELNCDLLMTNVGAGQY